MEKKTLRVEGIYDQETLKNLIEMGIEHFCFDFRAKSFNFLQQYKFLDFLRENYQHHHTYYLRYEGERDFIIQKMIDDLKLEYNWVNFYLEFSGGEPLPFVEQYSLDFYYHAGSDLFRHPQQIQELDRILKSKKLKGIVLHDPMLLENFIELSDINKIWALDWDTQGTVVKKFQGQFDILSFPINDWVEDDFRIVNFKKLGPLLEGITNRI